MNAVITVTGKDTVGIIAKVSNECFVSNANILDITQKVFGGMFVMTMLISVDDLNMRFADFVDKMNEPLEEIPNEEDNDEDSDDDEERIREARMEDE